MPMDTEKECTHVTIKHPTADTLMFSCRCGHKIYMLWLSGSVSVLSCRKYLYYYIYISIYGWMDKRISTEHSLAIGLALCYRRNGPANYCRIRRSLSCNHHRTLSNHSDRVQSIHRNQYTITRPRNGGVHS